MAGNSIRIKATAKDGFTEVKALIKHAMEVGTGKDEGKPAKYIEKVTCTLGEKVVMAGTWTGGISQNPFFAFKFQGGEAGETLKLSWEDSTGESDSLETTIK